MDYNAGKNKVKQNIDQPKHFGKMFFFSEYKLVELNGPNFCDYSRLDTTKPQYEDMIIHKLG
jgi:hypothetical protein